MKLLSIRFLALVFMVSGAAIGVPALIALMLYAIHEIGRFLSSPTISSSFGDHPDALLLMLKAMSETMGAMAKFASEAGEVLYTIIASIASAGLTCAAALWVTGRGLRTQANWARYIAGMLLVMTMLASLLFAMPPDNIIRIVLLLFAILCLLWLSSLWRGYMPPNH